MFDMNRARGNSFGYQLTIRFHSDTNKYSITGYTMDPNGGRIQLNQDGATLYFDSMEDVVRSLNEYQHN